MDKVEFFDEESKEYIELYVLEQTRLNGADYLLVTVDEEGDSDALILINKRESTAMTMETFADLEY